MWEWLNDDTGFFLFRWCNSVMSHAITDCLVSTQREDELIELGIWVDSAPPPPPPPPQWTFWNTFSKCPSRGGQRQALNFLLHNGISSNQRGINQRHLILSERLWDYLETPFLLLKVKRGSCCDYRSRKKRKEKKFAEWITDEFEWFYH